MAKSMYIIDYWLPFPDSEYGGLINVVASSDEECLDILTKWHMDDVHNPTMECVKSAMVFPLCVETESRVIADFTT